MAKGQRTFSTSGREVKRMESTPIPAGTYEVKLGAKNFEVKVKDGPGNLPYLNGFLEVLGTGGESGKNRRVYHRFFLDLTPAKDGIAMVDRGAGLTALARATGTPMDNVNIITKTKLLDSGAEEPRDLLDPKDVKNYLASIDGTVLTGKIKVTPGDGTYGPKNEIEYFAESEGGASNDDEEVDEEDEDEEEDGLGEDEDADDEEEADEDDEDEEEAKPAKKAAPPAKKQLLKKRR